MTIERMQTGDPTSRTCFQFEVSEVKLSSPLRMANQVSKLVQSTSHEDTTNVPR
jgi:hypothetical protein